MTTAKQIIAELAAQHMPKPANNMFASEIIRSLHAAGYIIIKDRTDPEGGTPGRTL